MKSAFGLIEYRSIARGLLATDAMLKSGNVELISALPLCPGKLVAMVCGEIGAVQTAVGVGFALDPEFAISRFVLPNMHESIIPALTGTCEEKPHGATAIVEVMDVCSAVAAADAAAKTANVTILEVRLARAMGGKSYVWLCGRLASVESAVVAAEKVAAKEGLLLATAIIPSPHRDLRF